MVPCAVVPTRANFFDYISKTSVYMKRLTRPSSFLFPVGCKNFIEVSKEKSQAAWGLHLGESGSSLHGKSKDSISHYSKALRINTDHGSAPQPGPCPANIGQIHQKINNWRATVELWHINSINAHATLHSDRFGLSSLLRFSVLHPQRYSGRGRGR